MKIISASVTNFGSYKKLDLNFQDKGLTLISGPTGSGKSTLCDVVPWVLFGVSAKGGAVSDVISWNAEGPTDGKVIIEVQGTEYGIRRIRGGKSNDLFFFPNVDYGVEGTRGKDLADTQKLINNLLGVNAETYLAGSYLHEYSQTSQFFTTTAKNRRSTTEQLVDLSLAISLQDKVSAYTKELKEEKEQATYQVSIQKNTLKNLQKYFIDQTTKAMSWSTKWLGKAAELNAAIEGFEDEKAKDIQSLQRASYEFEEQKAYNTANLAGEIERIESFLTPESYFQDKQFKLNCREKDLPSETCEHCGSTKDNHLKLVLIKDQYALDKEKSQQHQLKLDIIKLQNELGRAKKEINPYTNRLDEAKARTNHYVEQLEQHRAEVNPHGDVSKLKKEIKETEKTINTFSDTIETLNVEISDLQLLSQTINEFRGTLIQRTVDYLESTTNTLLEKHFDAELRVKFTVEDSDKLDVEITKDGNSCSFTALSKGQTQILKLAFGCSVMKAISNYAGVSFNTLFFDECASGLDEAMKSKAFSLLETLALEYENIFVVDHSEGFKTLFSARLDVELTDQGSQIEQN